MDSIIINENDLYLIGLHSIGLTHSELKVNFWDPSKDHNYKDVFLHIDTLTLKWNRREKIMAAKEWLNIDEIRNTLVKFSIKVITFHSELYPIKLKELYHAPYIIYVRWDETLLSRSKTLGIIGTRKNTFYGKKILHQFIPDLINHDYTIISGWAYGIDSLAHSITLEHRGKTISVFGTGIDTYYPVQNKNLFDAIIDHNGTLISCFPLWTKPESYNFPIRNEIVAGLSKWILVVEAWIKSGTLITAHLWLEQGKDIFAVPWNIFDSSSEGTNMLIATGEAKCTLNSWDIIQEYEEMHVIKETFPEKNLASSFTDDEKMIIHYLQEWINTVEGISLHSKLSIQDTTSILTILEMNWYIEMDMFNVYHIR